MVKWILSVDQIEWPFTDPCYNGKFEFKWIYLSSFRFFLDFSVQNYFDVCLIFDKRSLAKVYDIDNSVKNVVIAYRKTILMEMPFNSFPSLFLSLSFLFTLFVKTFIFAHLLLAHSHSSQLMRWVFDHWPLPMSIRIIHSIN